MGSLVGCGGGWLLTSCGEIMWEEASQTTIPQFNFHPSCLPLPPVSLSTMVISWMGIEVHSQAGKPMCCSTSVSKTVSRAVPHHQRQQDGSRLSEQLRARTPAQTSLLCIGNVCMLTLCCQTALFGHRPADTCGSVVSLTRPADQITYLISSALHISCLSAIICSLPYSS